MSRVGVANTCTLIGIVIEEQEAQGGPKGPDLETLLSPFHVALKGNHLGGTVPSRRKKYLYGRVNKI